ncbi:hypothetical protein PIB30_066136 [Stylosanthes scabra]|uniref:CCHC-type domain-containing protein n=1 Tax=Stylosanthes scabra TaxID=79078 RepID=A0ABU6ZL02_9FABA|nr:hypothetical protein [Stylosanthes scabra]
MSEVACKSTSRFNECRDSVLGLNNMFKADEAMQDMKSRGKVSTNPKGRGGRKKPQMCSICKQVGHNRASCPQRTSQDSAVPTLKRKSRSENTTGLDGLDDSFFAEDTNQEDSIPDDVYDKGEDESFYCDETE